MREFRCRYLGGHPLHPKPCRCRAVVSDDAMIIPELDIEIPYSSVEDVRYVRIEELLRRRLGTRR